MKLPKLLFVVLTASVCVSTYAKTNLSVESMNANQDVCFNLVEKAATLGSASSLNIQPCTLVIKNQWTSKEGKAIAFLNRGLVKWYQANLPKAERDLKNALKLNANLYSAHIALAQIYTKSTQLEEAIEHYGIAIRLNDSNPKIVRNLQEVKLRLNTQMFSQKKLPKVQRKIEMSGG